MEPWGISEKTARVDKKRGKGLYTRTCCVRFVENEQISERAGWERPHNFSLAKSRSWLMISKIFVKSSATMEVRQQLSKLRSTTSEMWSNSVVLWDWRKPDWQEGRILKLETKALSCEKQIYLSFERKGGSEVGRKEEGEEGLLVLRMGKTIECF